MLHIITGLGNGGAEAVLYRLVIQDSVNKHVVISLMDMGKYGSLLKEKDVEVFCLNMPKGKLKFDGLVKLWRFVKSSRPDVVQTWMYHADFLGGVVARLAGVKRVFWNIRHTDLVVGDSSRTTVFIARLCARLSYFVPEKIICCAEKAARYHSELGYNKEKMVVIGNGFQLDKFLPDLDLGLKIRNEFGREDIPLVGMVGRFNVHKDHKNLMDALGLLRRNRLEFVCVLIGPDINVKNEKLLQWVRVNDLEDNVFLLGERFDIPAVMNSLDIHVLSSSTEAFPNVIAEAMACGIPCVTTDVGDADFIVGDTGWVVPPKNSQLLANALGDALTEIKLSPNEWRNRKSASRERIEACFSIDTMLKKYQAEWFSH